VMALITWMIDGVLGWLVRLALGQGG
jgi:hypothetical protein